MENATKLLWLDYWASRVDSNYEYAIIQHRKQKNGSWLVEAKLPYYAKKITRRSKNLMKAILSVADEACEIIEQLMNENPKLRVENIYTDGNWEIVVDDDGDNYCIRMTEEAFKEVQKIQQNLTKALSEQSETIINTISHWLGTTRLAYLHILDKNLFGTTNKEIMQNVEKLIKKLHKDKSYCSRTFITGDNVVSFGYKIDYR